VITLDLPDRDLSVLCLGAHPDDIEIGCGGTLLALAESGRCTFTTVVMTGSSPREAEARAAAHSFLGTSSTRFEAHRFADGRLPAAWGDVKEALEQVADECTPDLVLSPRPDDAHQDHRLIAELVTTVWRDALVLRYEIPKWDGDLRRVTHYVPLTAEQAHRKVELLHRSFPSQHGRDWWSSETFLALLRLRGMECRAEFAEGFATPKMRLGV
jgi:LmbE family N-acetylglucosaminyl deacetylase